MWVRGKNERGLVISQLPPPILPSSSPSTHHTACSSSVLHGFLTLHLIPLPWLLHVVLHSHFSRFLQRSSNRRPATFFGYVKSWVTGARDEEGDEDLEETDGAQNGGAAMAQAQAQSAPPAASASVAATRHTENGIAASSAAPQTEMAAKVRACVVSCALYVCVCAGSSHPGIHPLTVRPFWLVGHPRCLCCFGGGESIPDVVSCSCSIASPSVHTHPRVDCLHRSPQLPPFKNLSVPSVPLCPPSYAVVLVTS